jgi:hypothetical protein
MRLFTKVNKKSSLKAKAKRPSGLIKRGRKRKCFRVALIKVENVLKERISILDLNNYRIVKIYFY